MSASSRAEPRARFIATKDLGADEAREVGQHQVCGSSAGRIAAS